MLCPNREVISLGGRGVSHHNFRFLRWNKKLLSLEKGPAQSLPIKRLGSIHQLIHRRFSSPGSPAGRGLLRPFHFRSQRGGKISLGTQNFTETSVSLPSVQKLGRGPTQSMPRCSLKETLRRVLLPKCLRKQVDQRRLNKSHSAPRMLDTAAPN